MANSGGTRLGVKRSLRRCRRVPFNLFPPIFQGILLLSSLDSRSVHLSTSFRWIYSFPCCFALRKVFESGQKSVESFVHQDGQIIARIFINCLLISASSDFFLSVLLATFRGYHPSRNSNLLLTKQHVSSIEKFSKRYLCGKYTILPTIIIPHNTIRSIVNRVKPS